MDNTQWWTKQADELPLSPPVDRYGFADARQTADNWFGIKKKNARLGTDLNE